MADEEFDDFVLPEVELDAAQDDFYQILGVARDATTEEITVAFRHLSKIYHPDKHSSKGDKLQVAEAERLFAKIKHAYEILIDPNKRAIYDITGEKGLQEFDSTNTCTAVIPRYRTAQEIREEYERQMRERQEREIERRTNPRGNMTVSINATEIFNKYEDEYYEPALVEITSFSLEQSVETPLTDTDTFVLHGNVSTDNGRGRGAIYGGLKKTFGEKSWGGIDVGGGMNGMEVDVKAGTQFAKYYWASVQAGMSGTNTGFSCQLNNQLTTNSIGSIVWRTGKTMHGLQCSYVYESSPRRLLLSLHLGVPHSFGLINFSYRSEERGEKYKTALKIGTFGAFIEYGVEKKLSSISTVGATVMVGIPIGVSLKIRVNRNNQSYVFPITLAEEIMPAPIFYATVTPVLLYMMTKRLFLDPYEKEKTRKEKEKLKELYKQKLEEKRAEAEAAINLMQETYCRVEREESNKGGLVISEAYFGVISAVKQLSSEIICVTIPLQCLVKGSKLVVPAGNKCQLPGFYDPAPGEEKSLLVRYTFNREHHESFTKETDVIKLPKLGHRVQPL